MSARPKPLPDADSAFFWEGCARGELLIARCTKCEHYVHPPLQRCNKCGGSTKPNRSSGNGTIHSYTITHRELPGFEPPFNVVLIELDEGVRLVSNLLDAEPEIGMRVHVSFEDGLPLFKKAEP
ncbi:MAG: Zn-ribbon domain-containing OB-fold protein [Actinomycetota bacterium]